MHTQPVALVTGWPSMAVNLIRWTCPAFTSASPVARSAGGSAVPSYFAVNSAMVAELTKNRDGGLRVESAIEDHGIACSSQAKS